MIVGEKVLLCGLTKDAAAKILQWVNQPELKPLTGTVFPVSEYEHEKWLDAKINSKTEKLFLIQDKTTKEDIGTIGIKNIDYINGNAELYISIGDMRYISQLTDHSAHGYGQDAIATMSRFCFSVLRLHKLYAHVFASNERSIHCFEKVGYHTEGKLVEHHYYNGRYEDVLVLGLLCGDLI